MRKGIVCKFGGTSLANSTNIEKVVKIVKDDKKQFVVVSAPGKREKDDIKITDLLIKCFELSKKGQNFSSYFESFKKRFEEIKEYFKINFDLGKYYSELLEKISGSAEENSLSEKAQQAKN